MLTTDEVTACLVTRGDADMQPIFDTLIFPNVIVWDNSAMPDWKVAGRYMACLLSETRFVYFQDDDTIVPQETQHGLLAAAGTADIVATWGHGENPDGYDDLPLVCGGAIADKHAAWDAIGRYAAHHPLDTDFMYEADFAVGVLYRNWHHITHPFDIRDIAENGQRLADEPWQRDLKLEITTRARAIRDTERDA